MYFGIVCVDVKEVVLLVDSLFLWWWPMAWPCSGCRGLIVAKWI